MEVAHRQLIGTVRAALENRDGAVLNLGAGNGVLVGEVCKGTRLTPMGVELDSDKVGRAKLKNPNGQFVCANIFDIDSWPVLSPRAVLLIDRTALEAPEVQVERLVSYLRIDDKSVVPLSVQGGSDSTSGKPSSETESGGAH